MQQPLWLRTDRRSWLGAVGWHEERCVDENGAVRTWYVVVEDPARGGLPAILDQVTGSRVDSVSAFVSSLAERGLRRVTIRVYGHAICGFLQFCCLNPREKGHRGTTLGQHLKRYIVGLALKEERDHVKQDLPVPSPSRERARLRTFYNTLVRYLEFCAGQEIPARLDETIPSWHEVQQALTQARTRPGMGSEAAKTPPPHTTRVVDAVISEPELRSLVAVTDERAGLAMLLFYYLGLDAKRAVTLRRCDVRVDRGTVAVATRLKSRRRQIEAFVLPASTVLFSRFLSRVPATRDHEPWLFPSRDPGSTQEALSAGALQRLVTSESGRVGRRVTVRQLQIWGAAEALRKGESMDTVLKRIGRKAWRGELRRAVDVLSSPSLFPRMGWAVGQESEGQSQAK
jgi:integrase